MTGQRTISCFVAGTDTGVGKTLVSTALLHALARHHQRVVGMKPVAAGTMLVHGREVNEDVLALRAASTLAVPAALDNPVLLSDAVSPHVAAARAARSIDIAHIVACHRQLLQLADAVVVEGAGGFLVPLSANETGANLAQALDLPVVLVVGLRLGCLNHALLTLEALRSRGLRLAGWVANHIDPSMLVQDDNISFLQQQLNAPLLARVAWQCVPDARTIMMDLPLTWR
jgi:dethiobiotin synthetase